MDEAARRRLGVADADRVHGDAAQRVAAGGVDGIEAGVVAAVGDDDDLLALLHQAAAGVTLDRATAASRSTQAEVQFAVLGDASHRSQALRLLAEFKLAQANLDGGGNTDQKRRARSPLPVRRPRTTAPISGTDRL